MISKGQYSGFYKYDNINIQRNLGRDQTFFEIDITEIDGQSFCGTVRDEPIGQPGIGTIKGRYKGNKIYFIKQMQIAQIMLPDGQVKTSNKMHPKIYYEGIVSEDRFEGTWKIKFGFILKEILPLIGIKTTGSWEMRKK